MRALEASRATGAHGLPLMGGGDWNDGMNRVGTAARARACGSGGSSPSCSTASRRRASSRGEAGRAADYREWAARLVEAIEREAWDGAWYRRAYFDDGTPLGTHEADECRIDAIAQAWAVIARTASRERAERALQSVEEKLVRREDGLIALLTPPFDRMSARPRLHQGLRAGSARERRPVHARARCGSSWRTR